MLAEAVVSWLVEVFGTAGLHAGRRFVLGNADERKLRTSLEAAVATVINEVPEPAREALTAALRERFDATCVLTAYGVTDLRRGLLGAFEAQLDPLLDRTLTGTGKSYLVEIGVDEAWLKRALPEAFIHALRQLTASDSINDAVAYMEAQQIREELRSLRKSPPVIPGRALDTLPRDISDFTNRVALLKRIERHCTEAATGTALAVCVIDGMAGVGKTALAVRAAHSLAPQYPDGRLFLDLHAHSHGRTPLGPFAALETLLRALGIDADRIPPALDQRVALWRSHLANRSTLIVLDNALDDEQVRPLLVGSSRCAVIVTCRRRMLSLDSILSIPVEILPTTDAAELFARIADRHTTDPDAVNSVIDVCGYLPIAIRVVARWLHHHPVWSPRDMLDELAASQDRLTGIDAERGSIVTAAFELSYSGLGPTQKRIFRRLGLHPSQDFSVFAVAALDNTEAPTARRSLEELYNQNLLNEPSPGRYQLHDLLHEYSRRVADEQDPPAEQGEALSRLLDFYTFVATKADHLINLLGRRQDEPSWTPASIPEMIDHAQAMEWMETERPNLHACVKLAAETGREQQAARLARAITYFLRLKGYWTETLDLCRNTAALCVDIDDTACLADIQFYWADVLRLTGHHAEARDRYEGAIFAYRELGDQHREARAIHSIGDIERGFRRYPEALQRYEHALRIYRSLENEYAEPRALHSIADTHRLAGRHGDALELYSTILDTYRLLGDSVGEVRVLHSIGDLNRISGDTDRALTNCQDALTAYRHLGDRLGEADALHSLGETHEASGLHQQALQRYIEALDLYRTLGNRHGQTTAWCSLGRLHQAGNNSNDARPAYESAAKLARELDDPHTEASALHQLGKISAATGQVDEALTHLRRALAIQESLDVPHAADIRAEIAALTQPAEGQ